MILLVLALALAGCSELETLKSSDTEMVVRGQGPQGFKRGFAAGEYALCVSGTQGTGGFASNPTETLELRTETGSGLVTINGLIAADWASPEHPVSVPPEESLVRFKVETESSVRWIVRMEPTETAVGCGS